MSTPGFELLSRRIKGVCIDCGRYPPLPDAKSGFPLLRCASCEQARIDGENANKKRAKGRA